MITLICSANARKQFKLKTKSGVSGVEWRLDTLDDCPCGYSAIITNLETLFTILVPASECASFDRLFDYFRIRLQFTLVDAGALMKVSELYRAG